MHTYKDPKREDIDDLAEELYKDGVMLSQNPKDERVNQLITMLSSYAVSILARYGIKDPHKRDDLAQDALITAVRYFDSYDPERGKYSVLFFDYCKGAISRERKMQNKQKRKLEKGKQLFSIEESTYKNDGAKWRDVISSPDPSPLVNTIKHEESEILHGFTADDSPLNDKPKRVLSLMLQGYNGREIGGMMGCSRANVNEIYHKSVKPTVMRRFVNDIADEIKR